MEKNWHITPTQAVEALANEPSGKPFIKLLERGGMYVEIYAPEKVDLQTPHDQDEIYVIISGSGVFFNDGERSAFKPGDLLFVPAGIEHRFENFTGDFKTWVIFV
jgi:mannose-6-phosphate isomerase-like protein (cupin superfamily)